MKGTQLYIHFLMKSHYAVSFTWNFLCLRLHLMPILQSILRVKIFSLKTRAVRGSDYSPTIVLSEEKDKFVTEKWRERKVDQ